MARAVLVAALLAFGTPVVAQEGAREVTADLDGDGTAETYRLHYDGPDAAEPSLFADLSVQTADGTRLVQRIAWSGGMHGTLPWLEVGPDGAVLVESGNEAYGQERWHLTLRIAHHGGDWRVAGVDYAWRNTLDLKAMGSCEVNLVSGLGVVEGPEGRREVAAPFAAPTLWKWGHMHVGLPFDLCLEEAAS